MLLKTELPNLITQEISIKPRPPGLKPEIITDLFNLQLLRTNWVELNLAENPA